MELGYAGASVDRIVQRAGGSKGTVYRHFGCKADLFAEIITALVARMTAPIEHQRPGIADGAQDLAATLARFGRTYLDVLVQPQSLALYRMVIAEGANFPDLARVFYERGPGQVATIHINASQRGVPLFERLYCDFEAELYGGATLPVRGKLQVPRGPGLGLEPDLAMVDRYRVA